jgi:hypothetical protein
LIPSPKDRREQEGYQNKGSLGENGWGHFAITFDLRNPLARVSRFGTGSVESELSIASSLQFEEF